MLQLGDPMFLSVIWACDSSSPSSLLLCAVALAPGPILTMSLTLKSLSNSKMNCQSNVPLMKNLITLQHVYIQKAYLRPSVGRGGRALPENIPKPSVEVK
jgi:hypothetical protein